MHEARPGIDTDMRLHAEVPLPAFLRLVHLFVTPPLPALGRGRRSNQRGVNDRASLCIHCAKWLLSIVPPDEMPPPEWPATVVLPCGMGDARNLLMALAGDACIVIGGRAGTKSEVHLAWLHKRPLLPLVGCGGWSDELPANPPDERESSPILPWSSVAEMEENLRRLGLVKQTG